MKKLLTFYRLVSGGLLMGACSASSWADTNAVTVTGGYTAAGVAVGVGFSFVPTTNLIVTNFQLYAAGLSNALVRIWTSTNVKTATFVFGPTGDTLGVFSHDIYFVFGAGLEYTVTVQDGRSDGSTHVPMQVYLADAEAEFMVSPDLTGYHADLLTTNGRLMAIGSNAFLFGVNFGYYTTNLVQPPLNIQLAVSNSVNVSWPQSSPIYWVLQSNTNLTEEDWRDFGPLFQNIKTATNVTISPATGNRFFRMRPEMNPH